MSRKIFILVVLAGFLLAACAPASRDGNVGPNFWCHTGPTDSNHWPEFENLLPGLSGPEAMKEILRAFVSGDNQLITVVKTYAATQTNGVLRYFTHILVQGIHGPTDVLWIDSPGTNGSMYIPRDGAEYINAQMKRPGMDVTGNSAHKAVLDGEAKCRFEAAPVPVQVPAPVPAEEPAQVPMAAMLAGAGLFGFLVLSMLARRRPLPLPV